ncbi:MAG: hypothetical protein OSJ66_01340 [Clostridia bacterium]|nr:hypothetical protein [Clostridia bacterium]
MAVKEDNEITVKVKVSAEELYRFLEEMGFHLIYSFSLDDTYFVPSKLDVEDMEIRDIISKAVLTRYIVRHDTGKVTQKITFKKKEINENGEILFQEATNCEVLEIEDAKKLLNVIGYREILRIKEEDSVYGKDGFQLAVKNISGGDILIEAEIGENVGISTINELKRKMIEEEIPIFTDDFFVKKAEVELRKVLGRK